MAASFRAVGGGFLDFSPVLRTERSEECGYLLPPLILISHARRAFRQGRSGS